MTEPTIPADAYVTVPTHLLAQARAAKDAENLELLDDTVDSILESLAEPREHAEPDTNALRAEHYRLTLNFPEQGYDWRTPVTVLSNRVPELADEIDRLRAELTKKPAIVDTIDDLKALPVGAIIKSLRHEALVDVWFVGSSVIDDTEYRYMGVGGQDYMTTSILLAQYGPFEVLSRP